MAEINFIQGDATNPIGKGTKIITHICNDEGKWGAGFVLALSNKWKEPEIEYKKWFKENITFKLGKVQYVYVEEDIIIANMIAQEGIKKVNGVPPIRYMYLSKCLGMVAKFAINNDATIHMPKIGCGLAGGDWESIESIINTQLVNKGINVFVYELKCYA